MYDPCTAVNAAMDSSGQGFYTYEGAGWLKYGQANVVGVFEQFASDWNLTHLDNPIGVGDLSQFGGAANFSRHPGAGHPGGVILDLRPMRDDNVQGPTNFNAANYSRNLTTQLIQGLSALADVVSIRFNDPNINDPKIVRDTDRFDPRTHRRLTGVHDNHLHVTFRSATPCPVNLNNIHP
jgi:hypothetical protein